MSFSIEFMLNTSEARALNKNLQKLKTVTGTLRDSSSLINPDILIEGDISDFANCNYFKIAAFDNRYYFLTDIESVRNNLIRVQGKVDVLQTYRNRGILNCRGVVARQANKYNTLLSDDCFKIQADSTIVTKTFESGLDSDNLILVLGGVN